MNLHKITLQINLSPGDIAYAHLTVPALIKQHKEADKILLIVDTCKPGKTKHVNPELRFPEPLFSKKVEQIISIAEKICKQFPGCEMYVLKPDDPVIKELGDKYLNGLYYHTHDYGGCANMAYWLGFELPDTQYVLHYDGDMLLYQKKGYVWTSEAIDRMGKYPHAVAACPRYNTPFHHAEESPSFKHGVPFEKGDHYWLDSFFSTRCMLIDKSRFQQFLPLLTGRILIETLAVKYLNRGYPRSPEIIMYRKIGGSKGRRMILDSFDSWTMHPLTKPSEYIEHLPAILKLVHEGIYPVGHSEENIELGKWIELIRNNATA